MTRHILRAILVSLFLFAGTSVASASGFLDFNMDAIHTLVGPGCPATISYAGGVAPLVGSCISVDFVVGVASPANAGVISTIVGGRLDFTTGGLTGTDPNEWFFGSGGSITITGGIPTLLIPAGTTLMAGTWNTASVTDLGAGLVKITGGFFDDTKNETLANYYGWPGGPGVPWLGFINLSFVTALGTFPPSAFTSVSVGSGDILNFAQVPEPSTALLFGAALMAIGAAGRLRTKLALI